MRKIAVFFFLSCLFLNVFSQTVTYQDILNQKSAKELTGRNSGDDITAYVASNGGPRMCH